MSVLEVRAVSDPVFLAKYKAMVTQRDGCWEWSGRLRVGRTTHGIMSFIDHTIYAHRVAFLINRGPIPAGALVCHTCNNGVCQNPNHLYPGSHQSNVDDMMKAGTNYIFPIRRGMENNKATLLDVDVATIRSLYAGGQISQRALAKRFGCTQSTVWRLVHLATRVASAVLP